MLRSVARVSLLVCVGIAVATACGSDDSKKTRRGDEDGAGMGGEVVTPSGGGNKNFAGQPDVAQGGGGAAGQAPVVTPEGGMGGWPGNGPDAGGAWSMPAAGAGGTPPDILCCQAKTCDEAFPPANGMWGFIADDGCGHTEIFCPCPVGTHTNDDNTCTACQPDAEFCMSHCGDTVDNCGNPISCPDNCGNFEQTCYQGSCCSPATVCDGGCGFQDDYCGGTIDCGNNCDGSDCVNGACCLPNTEACLGQQCGQAWDGCQDVDCGNPCAGTTACIDKTCQESQCQVTGANCGYVVNQLSVSGLEYCGECPDYQACVDNVCIPICGAPLPG